MKRLQINTLTNNADAEALETARAALDLNSGRAVLPGGQVTFTIEPTSGELQAGNMVGFAYVPTVVAKDGLATTRAWRRWTGGDFDIIAGPGMVVGPKEVPPGVERVISLPLTVTDVGASSTFECGIFFYAPSTAG